MCQPQLAFDNWTGNSTAFYKREKHLLYQSQVNRWKHLTLYQSRFDRPTHFTKWCFVRVLWAVPGLYRCTRTIVFNFFWTIFCQLLTRTNCVRTGVFFWSNYFFCQLLTRTNCIRTGVLNFFGQFFLQTFNNNNLHSDTSVVVDRIKFCKVL